MEKLKTLYTMVVVIMVLFLSSCSMMPRTTLDSSSSVSLIESNTQIGKYIVNVLPLDANAVRVNSKKDYVYTLGKTDQLSVYVWAHPEFSSPLGLSISGDENPILPSSADPISLTNNSTGSVAASIPSKNAYTVDSHGNIFIPLIGKIQAQDKTIDQVSDEVTDKVAEYVKNPQVSARVVSFRSKQIYVVGEVNKPTMIGINDAPLDLFSALSLAGWVNLTSADVKNIYVLRQGVDDQHLMVYHLDASSSANFVLASGFVMKPADIVFVSTAGVAQFNRVATQFLNAAQILWFGLSSVQSGQQIKSVVLP